MRIVFLVIIVLFSGISAVSQDKGKDSPVSIPMFYGFYGYQWPGADMAERFGSNSVIGPGFLWKTKTNWLVGAEYSYIFGNNVKYGFDILEGIMTSTGNIISGDGTPAVVALFERGYSVTGRVGKLIPALGHDKNSGFFFILGAGYISHKIRIDVENNSAPQLKGDYGRGYDRLSGGFLLSQSVGYMYFGRHNLVNFTLAFDVYEGFTRGYREYLFDTRQPGDEKRFDLLFGPRVTWMIPLRKRMPREFYYY